MVKAKFSPIKKKEMKVNSVPAKDCKITKAHLCGERLIGVNTSGNYHDFPSIEDTEVMFSVFERLQIIKKVHILKRCHGSKKYETF